MKTRTAIAALALLLTAGASHAVLAQDSTDNRPHGPHGEYQGGGPRSGGGPPAAAPQAAPQSQPEPVPAEQELPMPETSGCFSTSTHIISDQPIALKRKPGATK